MKRIILVLLALAAPASALAQASDCHSTTDDPLATTREALDPGRQLPQLSDEPPLSLGDAMAELSTSDAYVGALAQAIGVDAERLRPFLRDPHLVDALFRVPVAQLPRVVDVVKEANRLRAAQPISEPSWVLPQRVSLEQAAAAFDPNRADPQPAVGRVTFWNGVPTPLPDEVVQSRKAGAEILNRLALNRSVTEPSKRFVVEYRGREITTVDELVDALRATGHHVRAWIQQDIASFLELLWQEDEHTYREVMAPLRVDTGYTTRDGRPIVVPAVHSAMMFEVRGPDFNTEVEFFQGLRGTKFYPGSLKVDQSWVGGRTVETYDAGQSARALRATALWADAVHELAMEKNLPLQGYGITGVCNDAVAVIQQLLTGRVTAYPLVMRKEVVAPWLEGLTRSRPQLAARYRELLEAAQAVPFDGTGPQPGQPERILQSIPFDPDASTPYPGVTDARNTLRTR